MIGGLVANDDWQGGVDALVDRVGPGPGIIKLSYIVSVHLLNVKHFSHNQVTIQKRQTSELQVRDLV